MFFCGPRIKTLEVEFTLSGQRGRSQTTRTWGVGHLTDISGHAGMYYVMSPTWRNYDYLSSMKDAYCLLQIHKHTLTSICCLGSVPDDPSWLSGWMTALQYWCDCVAAMDQMYGCSFTFVTACTAQGLQGFAVWDMSYGLSGRCLLLIYLLWVIGLTWGAMLLCVL